MSDRRGFTLVEVVLSLAIAAMVVAMLFAALSMGQRASQKGEARAEVSQRVMVLSDRLSWLIAGAYPYRHYDDDKGREVLAFEGEHESLEFVTTSLDSYSDDPADRAGLKHVRLHLGPEGLMASERIFYMTEAEPEDYVLEPEAVELEFEYLEVDPEGGSPDWMDSWDMDSNEYLPPAVKVIVRLSLDGRDVAVPPIIVRLPVGGAEGVRVPPPSL